MSIWPEEFVILKDNFSLMLGDTVLRTSMDVGPAKLRNRSLLRIDQVSFSMLLTNDVFQRFLDFYETNKAGIFTFTRPDNKKTVSARFSSVPSTSMNETLWSVGVTLEILP